MMDRIREAMITEPTGLLGTGGGHLIVTTFNGSNRPSPAETNSLTLPLGLAIRINVGPRQRRGQ